LRESDDAKYIGLAMPRFLARLPYGSNTTSGQDFDFEEDTTGNDSSRYSWANAAYAMAVNINRSFKNFGWCSHIRGVESGGMVEDLPMHTFPSDDGVVDMKSPTETAITDRNEAELADCGMMPLIYRKNTDRAVFVSAQSLQKPTECDDLAAVLTARLACLFPICRFAHFLKCMVRDRIGPFDERGDLERYLQNWIQQYVVADFAKAGDHERAQKPLMAADIKIRQMQGVRGCYTAELKLSSYYLFGTPDSLTLRLTVGTTRR
jgi:type VI secretion system protein ImpC